MDCHHASYLWRDRHSVTKRPVDQGSLIPYDRRHYAKVRTSPVWMHFVRSAAMVAYRWAMEPLVGKSHDRRRPSLVR
jgi:hypothetical protein